VESKTKQKEDTQNSVKEKKSHRENSEKNPAGEETI
jgi:hypothetical protein